MINYKLFFRWIVRILKHSLCFYSSYYPAGSKRALELRLWFRLHRCEFRKRQWSQKCDYVFFFSLKWGQWKREPNLLCYLKSSKLQKGVKSLLLQGNRFSFESNMFVHKKQFIWNSMGEWIIKQIIIWSQAGLGQGKSEHGILLLINL